MGNINIVADASPLIALASIQQLPLLPLLFNDIWLPQAVFDEVTAPEKPYAQMIAEFAQKRIVRVKNRLAIQMLTNDVDLGEAEAIVLAHELGVENLLIDDAKGRRVARLHNLYPIGTLGILLQAKKIGHLIVITPLIDQLVANQIRISRRLYDQTIALAGE
jgi:uncharacterized protein